MFVLLKKKKRNHFPNFRILPVYFFFQKLDMDQLADELLFYILTFVDYHVDFYNTALSCRLLGRIACDARMQISKKCQLSKRTLSSHVFTLGHDAKHQLDVIYQLLPNQLKHGLEIITRNHTCDNRHSCFDTHRLTQYLRNKYPVAFSARDIVRIESKWDTGIQQGVEKHYNAWSLDPMTEVPFTNGKVHGMVTTRGFNRNGWLTDYSKKEVYFLEGLQNGTSTKYDWDGKPMYIAEYMGGKQTVRRLFYAKSEKLRAYIEFDGGKVHGLIECYTEDGMLQCRYRCTNDRPDGPCDDYDGGTGLLRRSRHFKDGKYHGEQRVQFLDQEQNICTYEAFFVDGKQHGPEKLYNQHGVWTSFRNWENDLKHGPQLFFFSDVLSYASFWSVDDTQFQSPYVGSPIPQMALPLKYALIISYEVKRETGLSFTGAKEGGITHFYWHGIKVSRIVYERKEAKRSQKTNK